MSATSTIVGRFWNQVRERPNATALIIRSGESSERGQHQQLTWQQLAEKVAVACDYLEKADFQQGQVLATWLPNGLAWIVLDLACQSAGVVHAAIDHREPAAAHDQLLKTVAARGIATPFRSDEELRFCFRNQEESPRSWKLDSKPQQSRTWEPREVCQDATAQILFTSGSTGRVKAVRLGNRGLIRNALSKLDAAPQTEADLRINILPFAHAYARTCELSTWILSGGRLALARNWDDLVAMAKALRPTLLNCVPLLAKRIADLLELDPRALGGRLRLLQVGGAALPERLWTRLSDLGLPPLCGYGLTETGPVICSNRSGQQSFASVGPPVSGVDVRVDTDGQLWARSTAMMQGYLHIRDEGSKDGPLDHDGWLATGDLARIRSDGHVVILGRKSQQLILSNGYTVDPALIESRMLLSGRYKHCLVTADGDASGLVAWVQYESPLVVDETANQTFTADVPAGDFSDLPRYAVPREVRELPFDLDAGGSRWLTAKGTLRRKQLLEALQ